MLQTFSAPQATGATRTASAERRDAGRPAPAAARAPTAASAPADALAGVLARTVASRAPQSLPAGLQAGVERLSGLAMDDVSVTYDSAQPAALGARAFARGTEIHLAPGSERDLPHEAWHVVQHKRGDVRATFEVSGQAATADAGLEREADRMGTRAAAQEAPAPSPSHAHADRGTAASPPPHDGGRHEPVIQGRWLVDGPNSYFWEDELGVDEKTSPVPFWLGRLKLKQVKALKPGTYIVSGEGASKRPTRGKKLVLTLDEYASMNNVSKTPTVRRDTYSPFGRFESSDVTSFLPLPSLAETVRKRVLEAMVKDPTFKPITELVPATLTAPNTTTGFPTHVLAGGDGKGSGTKLTFVEEGPFGATYAEKPPTDEWPAYDPDRERDPSELTKLVVSEGPYKLAQNFGITPLELKNWSGDRKTDQNKVMGASAADVAENAGFDRDDGRGWEWLHLIAYSMGGLEVHGPQVSGNLVAGTSECNTQMIIVEEFLKDQVQKNSGPAKLFVKVLMFDEERHIGNTIGYDFELYNSKREPIAVYHWDFDALSRRNPLASANRSTRYAGREVHGGAISVTTHIPRSLPTTHHEHVGSDNPWDRMIEAATTAFRTLAPEAFIQHLKTIASPNGKLPSPVLDELGENLATEQMPTYLRLLLQTFGAPVVQRVVRSIVLDHPEYKQRLLAEVLAPLFNPHPVPDTIVAYCR